MSSCSWVVWFLVGWVIGQFVAFLFAEEVFDALDRAADFVRRARGP